MRRFSKILVGLLILVLFSGSSIAMATEIRPYASELIGSRSIVSGYTGSTVSFTARIVGTDAIDQIGFNSIRIQKYDEDTDTWDTVKAVYSKFGYNTSIYAYTVDHTGTSGEQYRCKVTFYAKDGDLTDTKYMTSNTVTAG